MFKMTRLFDFFSMSGGKEMKDGKFAEGLKDVRVMEQLVLFVIIDLCIRSIARFCTSDILLSSTSLSCMLYCGIILQCDGPNR
jgi:hypothetical protein